MDEEEVGPRVGGAIAEPVEGGVHHQRGGVLAVGAPVLRRAGREGRDLGADAEVPVAREAAVEAVGRVQVGRRDEGGRGEALVRQDLRQGAPTRVDPVVALDDAVLEHPHARHQRDVAGRNVHGVGAKARSKCAPSRASRSRCGEVSRPAP